MLGMQLRARRRVVSSGLGLVGGVLIGMATMAPAVATPTGPITYGWWTQANPGGAVGEITRPPDVPADGMLVQGASDRPFAVAAVAFGLPPGPAITSATLTLTVASGTVSLPSQLEVCPLKTGSFRPAQGGPLSEAPDWDCTIATLGTLNADGTVWSFSVTGLVQDGRLAVSILGTSSTDRVVLARPTASALRIQAAGGIVPTSPMTPPPSVPAGSSSLPPAPATAWTPGLQVPSVQPAPPALAPSTAIASPVAMGPSSPAAVAGPSLPATRTALNGGAAVTSALLPLVAAVAWRVRRPALDLADAISPSSPT